MHVEKFFHLTIEGILLYGRLILKPLSSNFGKKLTSSVQMMWIFHNLLTIPSCGKYKWAILLWMYVKSLNLGPIVKKGVENIMRTIISKTLFQDCVVVGHALLKESGFPWHHFKFDFNHEIYNM